MYPAQSLNFKLILKLLAISLPFSILGCGGSYNSTPPNAAKLASLVALEKSAAAAVHTSNAKIGYVFSDDVYSTAGTHIAVEGGPVHTYAIDPVSGMPSYAGVAFDGPPVKTKSIAVSPSDRFMYMLTGDSLLYTFSIGYSIFSEAEFTAASLNPLDLYNALAKAGYVSQAVFSTADIIDQLNALLAQPVLYSRITADNPNLTETAEIKKLKTTTATYRKASFDALSESAQKSVIRLNRLMVELAYPALTPLNKGPRAHHVVGTPLATPQTLYGDTFATIELDPLGDFVYVLGTWLDGYTTDPVTGDLVPIFNKKVLVYIRDLASGQLTLSGTQTLDIDQLIFSAAGTTAYGSNNGSLGTYQVDRGNGLLTIVGTAFGFTGWFDGGKDFMSPPPQWPPARTWERAPFRNMVADPTGKFLYLIASSGTQLYPDPAGNCTMAGAQLGSLVYTFIVDKNSGLLTQAGLPLDTTPHIITSAAVDAQGRFVQLLNTYEYSGGSFTPGGCAGTVSSLNAASVYSYYVEQATGKLIPSGTMQAGGAQLSTGFVVGGRDSVSLTGDATGRFLYQLNAGDMFVYNVDQASGALTAVGSPLTGATATPMPIALASPAICYTNGVLNGKCGTRSHSLTWAGY